MSEELLSTVRRWIDVDPDPRTHHALEKLLHRAQDDDAEAVEELGGLFAGRLAFGTAGLRAELGPGPLRMNRLVVRQTARGLLAFAREHLGAEPSSAAADDQGPSAPAGNGPETSSSDARRLIVIGYDARHQSDEFAAETASIFASAGWDVHVFDRPGPTPLLARQVMTREADIGVMVTASHNPPRDNGYKVYLGGTLSRAVEPSGAGVGAQITAPVDGEIAQCIEECAAADFSPQADVSATQPSAEVPWPAGITLIGDDARSAYRQESSQLLDTTGRPHRELRIVYTAMHGVGGELVTDLLRESGFTDIIPVAEQFSPDPDFPTADFPNPEEPGALDLALAAAAEHHADLVLANDPDADRLSAAVFDEKRQSWRQLSGDEIGALLGRHVLDRGPLRPAAPGSESAQQSPAAPVVANSIVSSRLLEQLCQRRGVAHTATLTGFKWLARVPGMAFGYEEAIGYCVDPDHVRDKDGVSAALILSELAAEVKAQGSTFVEALDEIAAEAGVFLSGQLTLRVSDLTQLGAITAALRANPPTTIAASQVTQTLDLSTGPLPGNDFSEATATDALIYHTDAGDRVIVRPSGTEPKVKCYLETVADTPTQGASPEQIEEARAEAATRMDALRESMAALLSA